MKSLLRVAALCLVTLTTGCTLTVKNCLDGTIEVEHNGNRQELRTGESYEWEKGIYGFGTYPLRVFEQGSHVHTELIPYEASSQCFYWDCSDGLGSDPTLREYPCNDDPGCNCPEF